jgi:hypothetical protein
VASEQVLDIPVRRHWLTIERPFQVVLDSIHDGISQPDIGALFATLAASTSYEEFSALVGQAQGSAGLMGPCTTTTTMSRPSTRRPATRPGGAWCA